MRLKCDDICLKSFNIQFNHLIESYQIKNCILIVDKIFYFLKKETISTPKIIWMRSIRLQIVYKLYTLICFITQSNLFQVSTWSWFKMISYKVIEYFVTYLRYPALHYTSYVPCSGINKTSLNVIMIQASVWCV